MNGSEMAATLWKQVTGLARQLLGKGLGAFGNLRKGVPRARLLFWGACLLLLAVWWIDHQAHLRQATELEEVQKQTATAISKLQAQATAALRDANERNTAAIHELEAKRGKLEREAGDLGARLQSLQANEHAQAAQVAALPLAELARRVTTELGGRESSGVEPPASGLGSSAPTPDSRLSNPALALSEPQLRRVAGALVERDACREQKDVVEAQFANCHAQVDQNAAIIHQQADSLVKLNQALSAKDEILARREAQQQAELKAVRGSRLSHLARAVEWVAVGILMGTVIR